MIKLESLSKHFGKTVVLDGIDLAIEKGEIVVIIGPSGTGKSTLLRCINFLEQPTAGTLTVGDLTVDVNRASRADILSMRRRTAFVFQNYALFANKTALQNSNVSGLAGPWPPVPRSFCLTSPRPRSTPSGWKKCSG